MIMMLKLDFITFVGYVYLVTPAYWINPVISD